MWLHHGSFRQFSLNVFRRAWPNKICRWQSPLCGKNAAFLKIGRLCLIIQKVSNIKTACLGCFCRYFLICGNMTCFTWSCTSYFNTLGLGYQYLTVAGRGGATGGFMEARAPPRRGGFAPRRGKTFLSGVTWVNVWQMFVCKVRQLLSQFRYLKDANLRDY